MALSTNSSQWSIPGWVIRPQVHASQPHHGALRTEQFTLHLNSINNRLDRIENKLDEAINP